MTFGIFLNFELDRSALGRERLNNDHGAIRVAYMTGLPLVTHHSLCVLCKTLFIFFLSFLQIEIN